MNEVKFIRYNILKLVKVNDGDVASLSWGIRMNYPRITVFTSNDTSKPIFERMITAPFDVLTFNMFLRNLKDVVNYEKGSQSIIECLNIKYVNGERTNDVYVQAKVHIGKDKEGVNYIAITSEGKPKIKFDLLPGKWHRFYDKNKTLIENKEVLSNHFTEAYVDVLAQMITPTIVNDAVVNIDTNKNNDKQNKKPTDNIEDDLGL